MRQVFVNGSFVPENEAQISIFDRGFLFGDGIYEVTSVLDRKLIDFQGHIKRLHRSLNELSMPFTMSDDELLEVHRQLIELNDLDEGIIYLQVTRGAADRDFAFPPEDTPNTIVLFTQKKALLENPLAMRGQHVISVDDMRWGRCDIKTVQLLYPSLAKMMAKEKGADDAWLMRDGLVMEGSSNNAHIITQDNVLVTRHLTNEILHGITRAAVLRCAEAMNLKVEERPFTLEEAYAAKEAFSTSASGFVNPVVKINDTVIGDGKPGETSGKLREFYLDEMKKVAL